MKLNLQQIQDIQVGSGDTVPFGQFIESVDEGRLPETTSADAGKYFKVDENGNIIKYEPSTSIGDGDFSDGHWDSFVIGSAIEELIQQYYDFITGGSDVTSGCLGVKVQEMKERLEDFMDYEIIMGDPIHFTSDPDNHNLIYGTYTITGVNKVDVIRIRELNTGVFDDLIGITFLNLDTYPSWRPEGPDFMMKILNAERTEWEIEYGDTYWGDPVAWDVELIPYEVRKRLPNSNDKSYQILEELHREDW